MLHPMFTVDPKTLAHCRLCNEPLYCLYDWTKRPYCWECMEEAKIENAKDILGVK